MQQAREVRKCIERVERTAALETQLKASSSLQVPSLHVHCLLVVCPQGLLVFGSFRSISDVLRCLPPHVQVYNL